MKRTPKIPAHLNQNENWTTLKAGFHQRRSRSRSRSRSHKRAYDLVKIENRSRKQSHKLDGIGVGTIRTFPFLPIPFTTPSLMIQRKLGCRSRKQNSKRKNQPIAKRGIEHCHWFILPLLLATPTMQFSLDRKRRRHKQSQCSASDSVGLIFTRSYRSTLLITTPTTLVKTGLPCRPCVIHALP